MREDDEERGEGGVVNQPAIRKCVSSNHGEDRMSLPV